MVREEDAHPGAEPRFRRRDGQLGGQVALVGIGRIGHADEEGRHAGRVAIRVSSSGSVRSALPATTTQPPLAAPSSWARVRSWRR